MSLEKQIQEHLTFIYGAEIAPPIFERIKIRLADFSRQRPELSAPIDPNQRVTEADAVLITYGNQVIEPDKPALRSLAETLDTYLKDVISSVHILPFFPYSSDDGFSIIDYTAVNPDWGDWEDIALIGQNFRLMFDAVINHISAQSAWFQGFLQGDPQYAGYFITVGPRTDLSGVTRPRTSPLLTPVKTVSGKQRVWTTFSADQVDLNYQNPQVLLEIIDVLLFYVSQGAEFIRLDAIAFIWKEIGTSCIHLPQTHRIIQLFRTILDIVAPNVMLITETNVPHAENVSYFGNGRNEAQMVYQFPLAPLILHTFHTGDAAVLQKWAAGLNDLTETTTFFNFIASHDGIGVRPAEGILTPAEIQALANKILTHRGMVSYKSNPDGSQSAYELNITLFDALSNPNSNEPENLQIDRFIASQAIMLAMVGVPGIYVHSLFGSSNNLIGVQETGRTRTINRQKWRRTEVEAVLSNPNARANKIFQKYVTLLEARSAHRAFHPNGKQQVIAGNPALFSLLRISPDEQERVLCIHNISARRRRFKADLTQLSMSGNMRDVLSGKDIAIDGRQTLRLALGPYEVKWLAG